MVEVLDFLKHFDLNNFMVFVKNGFDYEMLSIIQTTEKYSGLFMKDNWSVTDSIIKIEVVTDK